MHGDADDSKITLTADVPRRLSRIYNPYWSQACRRNHFGMFGVSFGMFSVQSCIAKVNEVQLSRKQDHASCTRRTCKHTGYQLFDTKANWICEQLNMKGTVFQPRVSELNLDKLRLTVNALKENSGNLLSKINRNTIGWVGKLFLPCNLMIEVYQLYNEKLIFKTSCIYLCEKLV